MMQSSSLFFCDECGAANTDQSTICCICHQPLDPTSVMPFVPTPINQANLSLTIHSSTPMVTDPLQPGAILNQRYEIISQIGQGGFGVIYKARDQDRGNKLVAVKEINFQTLSVRDSIQATDTYNREVMLLSKLRHENLPRIYDHFTDPHHWYLVMDFIEGETLEDALATHPNGYSVKAVLDIGIQLCTVLGYLHRCLPPIIFRDVKPANVMRTTTGKLYLIDFGIARHFRAGQAKDTGPLGSPGYAAPEQYGRAQTDERTDVYGLGATLQTLLTGKDPLKIAQDGIPPLSNGTKVKRLEQLLLQMLEQEAADRPRNMKEVKQQLERIRESPIRQAARNLQSLRESVIGWVAKHAFLYLCGLLIGSVLYALILFVLKLKANVTYSDSTSFNPSGLLSIVYLCLLCSWPFLFVGQIFVGIRCVFSSRWCFLGVGMLMMMGFIILAMMMGWIPSILPVVGHTPSAIPSRITS